MSAPDGGEMGLRAVLFTDKLQALYLQQDPPAAFAEGVLEQSTLCRGRAA